MVSPESFFSRSPFTAKVMNQTINVEEDGLLLAGFLHDGVKAVIGMAVLVDQRLHFAIELEHVEDGIFLIDRHDVEGRLRTPAIAGIQNRNHKAFRDRPLAAFGDSISAISVTKRRHEMRVDLDEIQIDDGLSPR